MKPESTPAASHVDAIVHLLRRAWARFIKEPAYLFDEENYAGLRASSRPTITRRGECNARRITPVVDDNAVTTNSG